MPKDWELIDTSGDDATKDRWQQSGSVLKNITWDDEAAGTQYTVTSGRTLYVTYVSIRNSSGGVLSPHISDDATKKLDVSGMADGETREWQFNTPLEFTTDITTAAGQTYGVVIGWEE